MLGAVNQIPLWHAVVLGVVQGLSEFLPISSSGHLILVPWLFGWNELTGVANADLNRTFDVALHLGTLVAVVLYFRNELVRLAAAAWTSLRRRSVREPDERLAWLLALSALPGATVGAVLEATIADHLGQIWLIASLLIVGGVILYVADRAGGRRQVTEFGRRDALIMGGAQACALAPGLSRSGITMSAGLFLGFDRVSVATISFLMSVPITAGACLYQGAKVVSAGGLPPGTGGAFVAGVVASAVTGAAAIWLVLRVVKTSTFTPFVIYRVAAGTAVLLLLATGFR
ncbi:MAG: undecaprenyl-diphosphatase [Actinomycetota bacterium]|nr:undecaprenyl-diphosphatase [Actinomycetota bacterium]